MPDWDECVAIWNDFAFPGFGENFIIPELHVCFGGPDDGVCHVSGNQSKCVCVCVCVCVRVCDVCVRVSRR